MELELTLHGGIYGTLKLAPVNIGQADLNPPGEIAELLQSGKLEDYAVEKDAAPSSAGASADQAATEGEFCSLTLTSPSGEKRHYAWWKSGRLKDDPLAILTDFLWANAKPVAESE